MERTLISHSEVEAFAQCKKKHDYAHIQRIQPKQHSVALNRGNAGHYLLEQFALSKMKGNSDEVSKAQAIDLMRNAVVEGKLTMPAMVEAITLTDYWIDNVWPTLGWKIIDVEVEYRVNINDSLIFPMKTDMVIEYRGEIVVVDHKFTYDPYPQNVIDLMPQIPKYLAAMRLKGINARYGIYNFIRTRKLNNPADRYIQVPVKPNDTRIKNSMAEQVQAMKEIQAIRSMPEELRPIPIRTANKMNCANCGFNQLCALELEGEDTKLMRQVEFEPNSYGYKDAP